MKILILSFYYEPDLCAGSFRTTAFVEALKNTIDANRTEIDILTTMPNRYSTFTQKALLEERVGNIRIRRIKLPAHRSGFRDQAYSFGVYFAFVLNVLRFEKYDLIYATSSRLFTAFLGAVVVRINNAILYLDIRDLFTDTMKSILPFWKWIVLSPILSMIETYTIRSAHRVNIVSKGFESHLRKVSPHGLFSFFPNGVDQEFLVADFRKKKEIKKTIITYAGNMGLGQGLENIIPQIAAKVKNNIEFRLVGDGGRRLVLQRKVKALGLNNVKIIEPVNRKELISIYSQSDYLFLHLNNNTAFKRVLPSKIFEYAATGKPIIAGVDGYSKLFIQKYLKDAMVFKPCSSSDFIKKFKIFEPKNVSRKGFVQKFYRSKIMNKMAKEFLSLYKEER